MYLEINWNELVEVYQIKTYSASHQDLLYTFLNINDYVRWL